jgi:type IV secretory pathway VirB10-like protein
MDDIGGARTAENEGAAVNWDGTVAASKRRRSVTPMLLCSLIALLAIAGALYYFVGGESGSGVASRQQPEQASERPQVAIAPAPSKSAESPPPPAPPPASPVPPQTQSVAPPLAPTPQQQSANPSAPSAPAPPSKQAETAPAVSPTTESQPPPAMSGRATSLPGNEEPLFVQVRRANIRSEPDRTGRIIGTVTRGNQVKVIGRSGTWVEVETDAGKGWISGGLLRPQLPASR